MTFTDSRPAWQRTAKNRGFLILCAGATGASCVALIVLLIALLSQGIKQLTGFNAERRDEAMQMREPLDLFEFDGVEWTSEAERLSLPILAQLDRVNWAAEQSSSGLEFTDEAGDLAWADVAGRYGLDGMDELRALDWYEIATAVTVPGDSWLKATIVATEVADFVTAPPSRSAEKAGIGPALMGTLWLCAVCGVVALPLGVGTAVFLEEYTPRNPILRRLQGFVQLNITNLAGVPSIVYGIIGLTAFVQMFGLSPSAPTWTLGTTDDWYHLQVPFGRGVLAGGLTLMLVILPIVIISSQEALRAVPDSLRQGALALGATRWQAIRRQTLPASVPGIMTGAILAMSRAIGEAAPVLIICGIVFIRFTPGHLMDEFTALPLQIYDWAGRPQVEFHAIAASGILVLLGALLTFNAAAVFIRQKFQKPLQ